MLSNIILTAAKTTKETISSSGAKDVVDGFDSGLDIVGYVLWQILDKTSPIIVLVLIGILAFTIGKTGFKIEDMHTQWTKHTFGIIILLICIALAATFSWWGDTMLGDYSPKDLIVESTQATASIEYLNDFNYPKVG